MALLEEYALTPCVFDATSYSSDETGRAYLQALRDELLDGGVVRDLRNGEWSKSFIDGKRTLHLKGKELLKKLLKPERRIVLFPAINDEEPRSDEQWCEEALASCKMEPLTGIITSPKLAIGYKDNQFVAPVNRLSSATWWQNRSNSVYLHRSIDEYKRHLEPIFRCSNSIMFIDGHLDPSIDRYHEFIILLGQLMKIYRKPLIEIHRGCYRGSGPGRHIYTERELRDIFLINCAKLIKPLDFKIEVFIWDDVHDRHIISNLMGIMMGNGLDTSASDETTAWTRIGKNVTEHIRLKYDAGNGGKRLKFRFSVP